VDLICGLLSLLDYSIDGGEGEKSAKELLIRHCDTEKAVLLEQYGKYWRIKYDIKI
jgi:hypothetical protein